MDVEIGSELDCLSGSQNRSFDSRYSYWLESIGTCEFSDDMPSVFVMHYKFIMY